MSRMEDRHPLPRAHPPPPAPAGPGVVPLVPLPALCNHQGELGGKQQTSTFLVTEILENMMKSWHLLPRKLHK